MNTKAIAAALVATTAFVATGCAGSADAKFFARCKTAIEQAEGRSINVTERGYSNSGAPQEMWHIEPGPNHSSMVVDYRVGGGLKRRLCDPMDTPKLMAHEWPISLPVPVNHISKERQAERKAQLEFLGID